MPKKRAAGLLGGGRAAKLPRRRRQHLFLVLHDWEKGYSIRKLDLSGDFDDSADVDGGCSTGKKTELRLPPAVFRLEAPRALSGLFTTFGTKIIAMHHTRRRDIPMWDVSTRSLTFGPRQKLEPNPYCNTCVEVDGSLVMLDCHRFMMLDPPPPTPDDELGSIKVIWKWESLPKPPFRYPDIVVSHAMHPDGRTIFYSTEDEEHSNKVATFSFDMESFTWTRHGEWRLPFKGRGYFDPELDAWVGLSGEPDTRGHLCACEVACADAEDGQTPPLVWKLSKDKLFPVDAAERHVGATLVCMGGRSKFCLVQCFSKDDHEADFWKELFRERLHYWLRVTTFSLKYDRNGDLRTATNPRVRYFRLPKRATRYCDHLKKPVAFWM